MLKPIFSLTNTLLKTLAKNYVSGIKIDSLPIWKGEATIDDIDLNPNGLNKVISESGGTVNIKKITTSRLSVKIPLFSAGVNPLTFELHSVDIRIGIEDVEEQKAQEPELEPPTSNVEQKQTFLTKLTSNILIQVDGIFFQLEIKGILIELIVQDFSLQFTPTDTIIKGKKIRGSIICNKTRLSLLADDLDIVVHIVEPNSTKIKITNLTAKFSDNIESENPIFFDLIPSPISADIVINDNNNICVKSSTPINLFAQLDIIPSVINIINKFAAPPQPGFSPLPNLEIDVKDINIKVSLVTSLDAIIQIGSAKIKDGEFIVSAVNIQIQYLDQVHTIIDSLDIKGNLNQENRRTKVGVDIDSFRISVPAQKELLEVLKSIKIPEIGAPQQIETVAPEYGFEDHSLSFNELPNLKVMSRSIEFEFDTPIIPTGFIFDDSMKRAKLQLRIYEPTYNTFIALCSFESKSSIISFRIPEEQLIPGCRWQILFPEPLTSFPNIVPNSVLRYQTSIRLNEVNEIKINVQQLLISLESYNFPIAAISLNSIKSNFELVIASLSLIGNPANIVNKSIAGVKEFYNQAFLMSDSLLFGIGKGSMNLLKGVTTGALEGFVGFTNTLEKSLSKFKFFDEEPNQRVIDELAHAISGMVTLPVREFHQQGVPGIFKGAGKGILGLVTVPATAFFSILKKTGVILLDKVGDEKIEEDLRLEKEAKELPTFTIE
ncbi:Vacuolar protein sorting-associated protein [Histomonas meleagridis]|uniref:Vacuolar protein sorting-associated protein n=1 Tax=Histomonas meleagridis TaxID=135588 RepID=UPI00355A01E1|nr:Vacuolar protein sorting-associated protein [Histomonas meleagridis]KAH0803461.1 Vacuolar protein sorting-associated protein [Histomonas meleagridis]